MGVYFSASINSFIPSAWKDDGTYTSESWPKDAVLLSQDESDMYWKKTPPNGMRLSSDREGSPCWVEIEVITPTFSQAISSVNAIYVKDRDELCAAWLRAAVADGVEESSRKEDVEAELAELDAQHAANIAAIKSQYGVE